jgi:phage baseplate assembly protein V
MRDQIRRLMTKLQASITRGIIKLIDDEKATQTIQVELRFDEIADAVEHFQPFGVSFHPTKDSEVLVLAIGSSQDNLVALTATDRSIRPTGAQEGEGGLYTPSGWKIFCDADDVVFLTKKDAAQSFMRGEEVKAALKTYADEVATQVGSIVVAGGSGAAATDSGTVAKAKTALTAAANTLNSDIDAALSDKLKGE